MNRTLELMPLTCRRVHCRADDRGVTFTLVCVRPDGHQGRCLTHWEETNPKGTT